MKYRELKHGETIEAGDEYKSIFDGKWRVTNRTPGETLGLGHPSYRRPIIDAPTLPEYRELEKGEVVKAGDEIWDDYTGKWKQVKYNVGCIADSNAGFKYRRKASDTSGAMVATVSEMMLARPGTLGIPAIDLCVECKANPKRGCEPCAAIKEGDKKREKPRLNPRRPSNEPTIAVRKGWDNVTTITGRTAYLHVDSNHIMNVDSKLSVAAILKLMKSFEDNLSDRT